MKNIYRAASVALGAAALTLGTALSAYAGPPWDIKVAGGYTPSPAPIAFSAVSGPIVQVGAGGSGSCTGSGGSGWLKVGPAVTNPVATSSDFWITGCTGPGGLPMSVTVGASWAFHLDPGTTGPTRWPGTITGLDLHFVDGFGGTTCAFDLVGTVRGTFDEGTQQLEISATNLTVANVQYGCLGLVLNGDPASLVAVLEIDNPATGAPWPVDIT